MHTIHSDPKKRADSAPEKPTFSRRAPRVLPLAFFFHTCYTKG